MNRKERRKLRRQEKRAAGPGPEAKGLLQKARTSLNEGNFEQAEKEFRGVTVLDPKNAESFHMRALIAYQNGRLEEAGEMILEAITRNDENPEIHANCGAIMNLLGRSWEAEAASRHAIELRPGYTEAHNNLAVALEVQGRLKEALESALKAIQLTPDYTEAHINLGNIRMRMGEIEGAMEAYRQAVKGAPDNSMARANLGSALREAGDLDAAEAECRKAIELSPAFPEAHNSLGNLMIAREDWAQAKDAFQTALKYRPGYLEGHLNMAGVMFKCGDLKGAESKYLDILKDYENLAEAHAGLGVVLLAAGELEKAVESFREAVKIKPSLGQAQHNLATAAGKEMTGDEISEIREQLESENLPEADRINIHFALGEINDQKDDRETAFADFEAGNRLRKEQLARAGREFDADAFDRRVDDIISHYDAALLDRKKGLGDPTEQPVFIVGVPRSGTTLVEQIAASHAEVAGKGEIDLIRILSGDDGDIVQADEGTLKEIVRKYLEALRQGAEDASRITDKMPFNFLYLGRIQLLFPGARVVYCHRDPLDTGMSCFQQNFTGPHAWSCDLSDIGRFQRSSVRLMDHWKKVLSLPVLDVEYEAVINDQEAESRRLIDFLGLDWDPACLDFHKSKRTVLTASNWQVRKPLYKSAIGRARGYEKFLDPLREGLGL